MDTHRCILKTKDGRYLKVRKQLESKQLKLEAVDLQGNQKDGIAVHIWQQAIWMAFRFKHSEKHYVLMENGGNLVLNDSYNKDDLPEGCWFKRENLGSAEHHGLRLKKELKYLIFEGTKLTLGESRDTSVYVTIEMLP